VREDKNWTTPVPVRNNSASRSDRRRPKIDRAAPHGRSFMDEMGDKYEQHLRPTV
jgi:hypothetical protein